MDDSFAERIAVNLILLVVAGAGDNGHHGK